MRKGGQGRNGKKEVAKILFGITDKPVQIWRIFPTECWEGGGGGGVGDDRITSRSLENGKRGGGGGKVG